MYYWNVPFTVKPYDYMSINYVLYERRLWTARTSINYILLEGSVHSETVCLSINYVLFEHWLHPDFTHVRLLITYYWNAPFDAFDC